MPLNTWASGSKFTEMKRLRSKRERNVPPQSTLSTKMDLSLSTTLTTWLMTKRKMISLELLIAMDLSAASSSSGTNLKETTEQQELTMKITPLCTLAQIYWDQPSQNTYGFYQDIQNKTLMEELLGMRLRKSLTESFLTMTITQDSIKHINKKNFVSQS